VKHHNPPQVNFDGPQNSWGHAQGQILAEILELPFTHDIGYATPGSLGSYCKDQDIACVTLEMEDEYSDQGAWAKYGLELVRFLEQIRISK
jgi:phosphoserine aminotransferase